MLSPVFHRFCSTIRTHAALEIRCEGMLLRGGWIFQQGQVERTFAWLNQFRRLRIRYEKRADIHEAFLSLGCVLICWNFLSTVRARAG